MAFSTDFAAVVCALGASSEKDVAAAIRDSLAMFPSNSNPASASLSLCAHERIRHMQVGNLWIYVCMRCSKLTDRIGRLLSTDPQSHTERKAFMDEWTEISVQIEILRVRIYSCIQDIVPAVRGKLLFLVVSALLFAPATQSRFLPNRHRAVCRVYELVSHNMNSPFSFSLLQHHVSQKEAAAAAAVRIEDSASRVRASDGVCGSIDRT